MAGIYEDMNRELILELYEVKAKLRIAEQKHLEDKISKESHLQTNLHETEFRLKAAEGYLASQNEAINNINFQNAQLYKENDFLKSQNQNFAMRIQELCNHIENMRNVFDTRKDIQSEPESLQSVSPHSPALENTSEGSVCEQPYTKCAVEASHEKAMTIAKKLKLNVGQIWQPDTSAKTSQPKYALSEHRIFVGHLESSMDASALKEYFSQYGEVSDVFFPLDIAGNKRGFAFVTFNQLSGAHPMEQSKHIINGRTVYLDWSCYKNKGGEPTKTLMISGIIQNASEEAIRKHFSRYGVIDMIVRAQEGKKKFSRFAFIHYRDKSSVDKALEDQEHSIDGHFVDCRRARNFRSDHGSDTKKKSEVLTKSTPAVIKIPSSFDPSIVDVTKLLIQNLSPNITAEMLRKHFSQYGTVIDAYVPTFYGTADPKGFGYIVMPSQEANFNSNKHVLMGRNLSVRADFSSDIALKTTTLLVSAGPEIMSKVTENDLKIFFSKFGPISSVRKPLDCLTKKASHYGFVEFTSHESVDKAMKNLAHKINGQVVCITKYRCDPS